MRPEGLRPDQVYSVCVHSTRHGTLVHPLPRPIATGQTLECGDLVLRPGGGIEGLVVDENGAPWPRLNLTIAAANAVVPAASGKRVERTEIPQLTNRNATTDTFGVYRVTGLPAGRYHVIVGARE